MLSKAPARPSSADEDVPALMNTDEHTVIERVEPYPEPFDLAIPLLPMKPAPDASSIIDLDAKAPTTPELAVSTSIFAAAPAVPRTVPTHALVRSLALQTGPSSKSKQADSLAVTDEHEPATTLRAVLAPARVRQSLVRGQRAGADARALARATTFPRGLRADAPR